MNAMYKWFVVALVLAGLLLNSGNLVGLPDISEDLRMDQSFGRIRHIILQDAVAGVEENYGVTSAPEYQPLEVHASSDPNFDYVAHSPYYTCFFKGTTVRMDVGDVWIEFELTGQELGDINTPGLTAEQNTLSVLNVFESVDLSYKVDTSLLSETLTLREPKEFERVVQKIQWRGITPEFVEDGSILFLNEEKKILKILPPFMEDATGTVCKDVHYELVQTETGYELHKVIDDPGLKWLEHAVYPVVIDPSMQTFEDAWESSGLTPYGQYFKNVKEYINPATGHLTVTQTDLVIPGRGLNLVISRVYETPAVFYGSNPYDYETPPTDVGKGWQLDFPYIGAKYVHLWGGTIYKIAWANNQFENHKGVHFILVKNEDNTYTLTTASGVVYEFDTSGKLTKIKDLDQNSITFTYTDGNLTSITDTIGRTVSLTYSGNRLWKITYNGAEIEFSYDVNGCLQWMEDFLDRRTSYSYNSGYNNWLLSTIEYVTTGYTTYTYNRFSDTGYYKYYVTNQRVYETNQIRHADCSYTGSFSGITASSVIIKNESDIVKGSYYFTVNDGLITERVVKNASGTPIRKYTYIYNTRHEIIEESVYADGTTLSYTNYYTYDNWGNVIYSKNAEGHEKFFSYANTNTSGYFIDNNGIIRQFTNAFSNSAVPSSVHTALLGTAEKQDATYVNEAYLTYDSEAHVTQSESSFGNYTTWLTFSGTFNEKTDDTSFPVDLTGHTVTGNGVLQLTGQPSTDTYTEIHTYIPDYGTGCRNADWTNCSWSNQYYKTRYNYMCGVYPDVTVYEGWAYIGPFTHYPSTLGYQSYSTNPSCNQRAHSFSVTTYWKAYPAQVEYNVNESDWKTVSSNLRNTTANITVPGLINGQNTLYFNESSSYKTRFSWVLYVPVDNTPDTYTTSMQYDTSGNVTSITDAESNTVSFTYSSSYSYAYLTEISATVGQDTITYKAIYDSNRGWITSIQQPKGVDAGSGYDTLYVYDLLGRITKKEFPLLSGQSQRSYVEAVYDDANRTVTIIDQLRHYIVQGYNKLGRLTDIKWYTGQYGSGTLYATSTYSYRYDNLISAVTDPGNHQTTYTYDFLGRLTQIQYPDLSTTSYSYDDTHNKVTFTNAQNYDKIHWYNWLNRLEKMEEEYASGLFAVTTYQYDEINHLTSVTDAESHTTTYTYDSLFGMTKITYPDSEYEEYAYDNMGNITSFTDCKGNEITYTYDDIYRLNQIQYQDQSTVDFIYDLNSNRVKMEDDSPNTGDYVEYSYDHWNRLTSEVRHIATSTYTVSYQYDVANRLTTLTYPDNMQILYAYDDLNRTTEIKRYVDGSNDEIFMDNAQYNTESLLTQFDYGNDLRATFSYDSRDRLSTLDVKDGSTSYLGLDFTYDNNNNITQITNGWRDTDTDWNSDTESYSYDGLDRLTSASCTSWSHTYSYDKVGNRTAKDSVTYIINSVDEVTALSDGTTFTYDDNGNRTQKIKGTDTWDYMYDYANRLIKVEQNDTSVGEYVYDGDSRRLQATENSVTTTYICAGSNVLYEETSTGFATYMYGLTGRLAKRITIQGETHTYYYHTDQLSSTRLVTDENKTIIAAVTYHPFGEACAEEGTEDYLFIGQKRDATGLYYCSARYYDSNLGRFITRDLFKGNLSNPQTLNRYTYCFNNPLKFVDPLGLGATFSDEEAQKAYEEKTGSSGLSEPPDSDASPPDPLNEPDRLYIDLPDGTRITLDEYGQSGNVVVGYGYMTGLDGNFAAQDQYLFIIVFDDEGNIENFEYFTDEELKRFMDSENPDWKSMANKFKDIVGKKNVQDLAQALDRLRDKIYAELLNSKAEILGGFIPYVGSIYSGISDVDQNKWLRRYHFLSELLVHGGLPSPIS